MFPNTGLVIDQVNWKHMICRAVIVCIQQKDSFCKGNQAWNMLKFSADFVAIWLHPWDWIGDLSYRRNIFFRINYYSGGFNALDF